MKDVIWCEIVKIVTISANASNNNDIFLRYVEKNHSKMCFPETKKGRLWFASPFVQFSWSISGQSAKCLHARHMDAHAPYMLDRYAGIGIDAYASAFNTKTERKREREREREKEREPGFCAACLFYLLPSLSLGKPLKGREGSGELCRYFEKWGSTLSRHDNNFGLLHPNLPRSDVPRTPM